MRRRLAAMFFPILLAVRAAHGREVKTLEPLTFAIGQPVRITGMDLTVAPKAEKEVFETDAKAARKRASAGLPPLDAHSYPTGLDGFDFSTMPFKQMFPLVVRQVARDWRLDEGRPVFLRITIDRLHTADTTLAILVASSDTLDGRVDVIDAVSGKSLGAFRVSIDKMQSGWAAMVVRGGGIREKLAEQFALAVAKHMSGRKAMAG